MEVYSSHDTVVLLSPYYPPNGVSSARLWRLAKAGYLVKIENPGISVRKQYSYSKESVHKLIEMRKQHLEKYKTVPIE